MMPPAPDFGRKIPPAVREIGKEVRRRGPNPLKLLRPYTPLDFGLDLFEWFNNQNGLRTPPQAAIRNFHKLDGWVFYRACSPTGGRDQQWRGSTQLRDSCLSGQALNGAQSETPYGTGEEAGWTYSTLYERSASNLVVRWYATETWRKPVSAPSSVHEPTPGIREAPGTLPRPYPDTFPNIRRHINPEPQPIPPPEYYPEFQPYGEPAPRPQLPPTRAWDVVPGEKPKPRPRPARKRPKDPKHERKTLSNWQKIGIGLAGAMDTISESSEVIDSLFQALPPERKKGKCDRKKPLVDQWGQYGIDNADCKLAVLYEHWNEVDVDDALRNLLKNQIEDAIHGGMHQSRPKGWGGSTQEADKEFGKIVNDVLDFLIGGT